MSLLKGLIDCCGTKGPLIKHNVPVWMSTAHQCYCFLTYPSLPSSPLFPPSCFRAHAHFANVTTTLSIYIFILPSILSNDLCSPFFLPLFCPSLAPTIPAPRLPASLQPSPLPLPRSSIVSAWFSSLSLSCSTQPCLALPCLSTVQPEPNAAHTASPFGLRGGEGKHFKLQIQPGKQGSGTDSWAHPTQAVWIWMFADIYRFVSSQLKYTYPLCLFLCLACRLTLAPWFRFR